MSRFTTFLPLLFLLRKTTSFAALGVESTRMRIALSPEEGLLSNVISPTFQSNLDLVNILEKNWSPDFLLYTRQSEDDKGYRLTTNLNNLKTSNFLISRPTKVIIHGWMSSANDLWVQEMRKQYLKMDDLNVICVNWYPASMTPYFYAAMLTKQVGEQLAALLQFLLSEGYLSFDNVHLIGHSLGAHVAGFAGEYLDGQLGRITGMDPAKPQFENLMFQNFNERLDPSDAIFVDIIHTAGGTLGFASPLGHIDFYPNGGIVQPGCPLLSSQSCSHERSYEYMTESIKKPMAFPALKCVNWAKYVFGLCKLNSEMTYMGEAVDKSARGSFFLETNSNSPYGKGY